VISKVFYRLYWKLFYRFFLKLKIRGFKAHILSFSDKRCQFDSNVSINGKTKLINVKVGRYTYFAGGNISNTVIGSFTSIGPNVVIGGLGKHPIDWMSTHPVFYSTLGQVSNSFAKENHFEEFEDVQIGSDVWIGGNVLILDGVKISDGAIIAAGSVVIKDVMPYEIVGGVPAKNIRYRFDSSTINELMHLKWWEFDDKDLSSNAAIFRQNNPKVFIEELKKRIIGRDD
jgi:acetyltransferase-like isoleucine patch superfamily enzyme